MAVRWFCYLVCLAGCAGFYVCYGQWLGWVVLLVCLMTPVLSLAVSLPAMCTFRPWLEMPEAVEMGQEAVCTLAASCAMPLPPYTGVLRAVSSPAGLRWTGRGVLHLPTEHCGAVTVAAARVRVMDYLGLFFLVRRIPQEKTLLIRPKPVALAHVPGQERLQPRAWQPKPGGGYAEHHELRTYRPGDSLNQVHWKLSAKMGQLVLRQAMEPKRGLVLVSLDLQGTGEELDRKLGRLLWLGRFLLRRQIGFEIRALTGAGVRVLPVENGQMLDKALDTLLADPAAGSGSIRDRAHSAYWHYHIGGGLDEA